MQAVLILLFSIGMVLFGLSQLDITNDVPVNSTVTTQELISQVDSETRKVQTDNVVPVSQSNSTDKKKENQVSSEQALSFANMNEPVEPPLDMVLTQQVSEGTSQPSTIDRVQNETQNFQSQDQKILKKEPGYKNKRSLDEVLSVNTETNQLFREYESIRSMY
ncbi:MAG TPA: hypothetical protein ENJ28_04300 [Gammaproteobacteria bacterium]|nr:hypothetical protein [Gammaproteobacteria bacterium]